MAFLEELPHRFDTERDLIDAWVPFEQENLPSGWGLTEVTQQDKTIT